ncbi:MAG: hypothetical protein QXT28_11960 [Thermofilaceae archaeon]
MELKELKSKEEIRFAQACIQLYGMPVPRFTGGGSRYFGLVKDGRICAVAWIHKPHVFTPVFRRFQIDEGNSYFVRRVATCCPGDHLADLLRLLAQRLREEGKENVVVLGLPRHSNLPYREAGFVEVGRTPRTGHPVYVLRLR